MGDVLTVEAMLAHMKHVAEFDYITHLINTLVHPKKLVMQLLCDSGGGGGKAPAPAGGGKQMTLVLWKTACLISSRRSSNSALVFTSRSHKASKRSHGRAAPSMMVRPSGASRK